MFTIRSAFVLTCATVVSAGLLIAPAASSRLASIQPGTYSGVINVSAGIAHANGGWSMAVASSGRVEGTLTVVATIPLPNTGACTSSVSKLVFDSRGTFSGVVAGANVVGVWRTSSSFSPSTVTATCSGQSTSTRLPSIPTTSYHGTFPLGQLLKGGSSTIPHVGTFSVTKAPTLSKGSSTTPPASSASVATPPPAILPPATPLPASKAPAPADPCHEVKSASGQIDVCVPSWLSGSASPGTTFIDKNGSTHAFSGELPPGATLKTGLDQYAALTMPATSSVFSLAPDSSAAIEPGYRNGKHLSICGMDPVNCTNAAGYAMLSAASGALDSAIGGKIPAAYFQLANGVQDLAESATESVSAAAEILASPNVYIAPNERTARRIASATSTATNVEVKVTAAGTSIYVMSGGCVVINSASGGFAKLTAGHDLFIPKSAALARKANLKTSIRSFNVHAVKQWWKK